MPPMVQPAMVTDSPAGIQRDFLLVPGGRGRTVLADQAEDEASDTTVFSWADGGEAVGSPMRWGRTSARRADTGQGCFRMNLIPSFSRLSRRFGVSRCDRAMGCLRPCGAIPSKAGKGHRCRPSTTATPGLSCKYITNPRLRKEPDVAGPATTRVPTDEAPSSNPEFPFRGTPFVPPSDDGMGRCGALLRQARRCLDLVPRFGVRRILWLIRRRLASLDRRPGDLAGDDGLLRRFGLVRRLNRHVWCHWPEPGSLVWDDGSCNDRVSFLCLIDAFGVTGRNPGAWPGWRLLRRLGLFDGRGSKRVQCPGIEFAGGRQNSLFLKIPDRPTSSRPHETIDRSGVEAKLFESFLDVQHLIRLGTGHAGDAGQPEGKKDDEG